MYLFINLACTVLSLAYVYIFINLACTVLSVAYVSLFINLACTVLSLAYISVYQPCMHSAIISLCVYLSTLHAQGCAVISLYYT